MPGAVMHSLGLFTLGPWAFPYLFIFARSRHKMLIRVVHRGYSTEDACLIGPLLVIRLRFIFLSEVHC